MFPSGQSILEYRISDNDLKLYNPYLKKLKQFIDRNSSLSAADLASLLIEHRHDFVSQYSFTIPYYDILAKVASYSPIVEIGAGSGYWARCLNEMGADVIAYDSFPPGEHGSWEWDSWKSWFDESWFDVIEHDESAAALHPDRTLFLAWPMPMNLMAYNALCHYKNAGGKTLIFIGDPHPGSSGDENFYRMLAGQREIENISLYSWPGISEKLIIYSLE